jgi:hypothetical protein
VSEEQHTVTLFYAVPVSVEGTVTQLFMHYCSHKHDIVVLTDPVVQGAGFHKVADVIENHNESYPLKHTHRL